MYVIGPFGIKGSFKERVTQSKESFIKRDRRRMKKEGKQDRRLEQAEAGANGETTLFFFFKKD